MGTHIEVKSQFKRDDRFRYGLPFDYEKIAYEIDRNPYANIITHGVFLDAIKPGFDVVSEDEKEVDWNEKLWDILLPQWGTILLTGKYERGFHKCLVTLQKKSKNTEVKRFIRVYQPKDYDVWYDDDGEITKIEAREFIAGMVSKDIVHSTENGDLDLKWCYEIIIRKGEKVGQGLSYIEPIWDTLYSLRTLSANATYFVIRVGGGMRVAKIPESKLKDTVYMGKITDSLKEWDSANGTITIPFLEGIGIEMQPSLELLSGEQINFEQIQDILLNDLAAQTGIPKERLKGAEVGLRSAETNQGALFRVLENIQRDYTPFFEWLVERFATAYSWDASDTKIQFRKRVEINETEQMGVLKTKMDILAMGLDKNIEFKSLIAMLDLEELKLDEEKIKQNMEFANSMFNQPKAQNEIANNGKDTAQAEQPINN